MNCLFKIYNKMPESIKGMWRGKKIESYISYSGDEVGVLYEHANMIGKLTKGRSETYSQFGQDWFVFHMLFHGVEHGFFLDIGANDPEIINNTLLFEKHGWNGLAFEPQRALSETWSVRKTECLNIALGECEKDIYFKEENVYSRVVDNKKEATGVVKQRKLSDVLEERRINRVNFLSIDVEGYEYQVLKGIDFSKVNIDSLLIEISDAEIKNARKTRDFLKKKGFIMIARLWLDDVWVNRDFFNI